MKWFLLAAFLAINLVGALFVLMPGLITYAEVPPKGITCSLCTDPEIQKALTAAATYGRAAILQKLNTSANWLLALAAFNTVAFSLALFFRRSNRAVKQNAPQAAPLSSVLMSALGGSL